MLPSKPNEKPWHWAIGGSIATALIMLAGLLFHAWPEPNPFRVSGLHSSWVDGETWRVEMDVRFTDHCRLEVSREFTDGTRALAIEPSSTYLGVRVGDLPYVIDTQRHAKLGALPTARSIWYEYKIQPGQWTDYLIAVTAWRCEGGFSGEVMRDILPVGRP